MLPRGGSCKTQRLSKLRTMTTEKGTKHSTPVPHAFQPVHHSIPHAGPKSSLLSTVKANNRALAATLGDKKQLCSKLKGEILCLRREKQELCETVSNLKLQLQSQYMDICSVVDHLTIAQRSLAQADTCLTSRLANRVQVSLSPISKRGGSRGATNRGCKVAACPMEVDGVQFLSPPGDTSSPSGPPEHNGRTSSPSGPPKHNGRTSSPSRPPEHNGCTSSPAVQEGHLSLPSRLDGQPGDIPLLDWSERQGGCIMPSPPGELTGYTGCTSLPNWSTEQSMCSTASGTELLCGTTNEREDGRSSLKRRDGLDLDLNGEEEGMSLSTQRPKRKCAPLSSSMVEPSLRDKLRRGDPFTTSFTTWSPCDRKDKSKPKKHYSAKRVALANITNKVMD